MTKRGYGKLTKITTGVSMEIQHPALVLIEQRRAF